MELDDYFHTRLIKPVFLSYAQIQSLQRFLKVHLNSEKNKNLNTRTPQADPWLLQKLSMKTP